MTDYLIFYIIGAILSLMNVMLAFWYFIKVKDTQRYVKLAKGVSNIFALFVMLESILYKLPSGSIQLIVLIMLLSSESSGLLLSVFNQRLFEQAKRDLLTNK